MGSDAKRPSSSDHQFDPYRGGHAATGIGPNTVREYGSMGKPFSYPELRARIVALLGSNRGRPRSGRLRIGALELDPLARQVWIRGRHLELSKKEFALLEELAAEPISVFTGEELLAACGDFERWVGSGRLLAGLDEADAGRPAQHAWATTVPVPGWLGSGP